VHDNNGPEQDPCREAVRGQMAFIVADLNIKYLESM